MSVDPVNLIEMQADADQLPDANQSDDETSLSIPSISLDSIEMPGEREHPMKETDKAAIVKAETDYKLDDDQKLPTVSSAPVDVNDEGGDNHTPKHTDPDGATATNLQHAAKPQIVLPNSDILQQLDIDMAGMDIRYRMQTHIEHHLLHSGHFCIRIFTLILTVLLILLSLSYTFGAISSTQLVLVEQCPGYDLEEIWDHSKEVRSQAGEVDSCWSTSKQRIDETGAFAQNTLKYERIRGDSFATFQCIIFSIFTAISVILFIYGTWSLITDIFAIKQQQLYTKCAKFKQYYHKLPNNSQSSFIVGAVNQLESGFTGKVMDKYKLYFGVNTNGAITRMIVMELWEIVLQTFALFHYNGYNVWDSNQIPLAHKPKYIYLFAGILSFNCIVVGILWCSYAIKQNKCNGLVFRSLEFCIDQVCDLFYAMYPFIVVFDDEYNQVHETSHPLWVGFGLLNNTTFSSFMYSAFPMMLLCAKSLIMTRNTIRIMRNTSYEIWLLVTKAMTTTNDKQAAIKYLANQLGFTIATEGSTTPAAPGQTVTIDDEMYDDKGNLKLNITQTNNMVRKTPPCRMLIVFMGALFIIYAIVLLNGVINHFETSGTHCNEVTMDVVVTRPELFVYDEFCIYKVYPFASGDDISDTCQCRVFQIDWRDTNASHVFTQNNLTQRAVIDAVLTQWNMLEKFETVGTVDRTSTELFEWKPSHFVAHNMKIFSWGDLEFTEMNDAISEWSELELFEVQRVDSFWRLPETLSKLSKMKLFKLFSSSSLNSSLEMICGWKGLLLLNIRSGSFTSIPDCVVTELAELGQFQLQRNPLTSFPLEMLNMTNLQQLDLYGCEINMEDVIAHNNVVNESNPFQYYPMRTDLNFRVYLDRNDICDEVNVSDAVVTWLEEHGACTSSKWQACQSSQCPPSALGNGQCDTICNSTDCYMDKGDCFQFCFTETACNYTLFLNEQCDDVCDNEKCYWDNGYCRNSSLSDGFQTDGTGNRPTYGGSRPPRQSNLPTVASQSGQPTMRPTFRRKPKPPTPA